LGSTNPSANPPVMPTSRYRTPAILARRFGEVTVLVLLLLVPPCVSWFVCSANAETSERARTVLGMSGEWLLQRVSVINSLSTPCLVKLELMGVRSPTLTAAVPRLV